MPLAIRNLGEVLIQIYDFYSQTAIYLPKILEYEVDTPCIVSWAATNDELDETALHLTCLHYGFKNWLNVAVVSDTCDDVLEKSQESLIAAFNADCRDGCWLSRMMNYRRPDAALKEDEEP